MDALLLGREIRSFKCRLLCLAYLVVDLGIVVRRKNESDEDEAGTTRDAALSTFQQQPQ